MLIIIYLLYQVQDALPLCEKPYPIFQNTCPIGVIAFPGPESTLVNPQFFF